jgi:hypothetical protein
MSRVPNVRIQNCDPWPPGSSPELVTTDVGEDATEPAVACIKIPKSRAAIPREQGSFLHGVLGGDAVMQDECRESKGIVDPSHQQAAHSIVPRHGRCGVVDHAKTLGSCFGLSVMKDERTGEIVRSSLTSLSYRARCRSPVAVQCDDAAHAVNLA